MRIIYIIAILIFFSCNYNEVNNYDENSNKISETVGYLNLGSINISDQELIGNRKLIDFIISGVNEGKMSAYYALTKAEMMGRDIEFNDKNKYSHSRDSLMSESDLNAIFLTTDTLIVVDSLTGVETEKIIETIFDTEDVTKLKLEQSWYYDENTKMLNSKVHSLKIMKNYYNEEGYLIASAVVFKINFK